MSDEKAFMFIGGTKGTAVEFKEGTITRITPRDREIQRVLGDIEPSEQQMSFLRWVAEGTGSGILLARAGTGKTFTIRLATKVIKDQTPDASVAVCVFANRNAREMEGTFPEGVVTGTQHGLCFSAYRRRHRKVKLEKNKVWDIIDEIIEDLPQVAKARNPDEAAQEIRRSYGSFIKKLVGHAKNAGMGYLVPNEPAEWEALVDRYDMWLESEGATVEAGIRLAREVLRRNNEHVNVIDFDDMLYLTLIQNIRLYQNDWLLVDEAQDTNPVQRALFKRMVRPGGRLVAVGDDRQGIFAFRGASVGALDEIQKEWNAETLPLTVSFRCCRAVGSIAIEFVKDFEVFMGNPDGAVRRVDQLELNNLRPGDAVLCRNTTPLVEMAYRLIKQGIGAKMVGRDIGEGLVTIVNRMKAKGIDRFQKKLGEWRDREYAKAMSKGNEEKAESLVDKHDAIIAVIESLQETSRTVPALVARIRSLFEDDVNGGKVVRLSTIHRAKGLEWDRVFIHRAKLLPSPYARRDEQIQQERNLAYVAVTRARKELVIEGEFGFDS